MKKVWNRERHVTRSVGKREAEKAGGFSQQEEADKDVVNSVLEADPRSYRDAMRSRRRDQWVKEMDEELRALEANDVWKLMRLPRGVRVLHTK